MQHFRVLLLQFYKPFWWYHLLFSAIGIYRLLDSGLAALTITLIFKLTGYASALAYQYYFNSEVYYYYRNTGYAVRRLYTYIFLVDLIVFIILTSVSINLMHLLNA